jgi:lysophospholipase L1-like esterase
MLDRIKDVERTNAKVVFIMAGTNDITRTEYPGSSSFHFPLFVMLSPSMM